jgi:hypothetical protein
MDQKACMWFWMLYEQATSKNEKHLTRIPQIITGILSSLTAEGFKKLGSGEDLLPFYINYSITF